MNTRVNSTKLICRFCNVGELASRQQLMCKQCFKIRNEELNGRHDIRRVGNTARLRASLQSKE